MFADKCEQRGIPFRFKTAEMFNGIENIKQTELRRDEGVVIYSSEEYLAAYVEICNEIKNETGMEFATPPILSGTINGFIGYGQDPKTGNNSYNSLYYSYHLFVYKKHHVQSSLQNQES